jgi:D-3-phosphoglycerate dehydrogenase / 2-oxoglutarate reductase
LLGFLYLTKIQIMITIAKQKVSLTNDNQLVVAVVDPLLEETPADYMYKEALQQIMSGVNLTYISSSSYTNQISEIKKINPHVLIIRSTVQADSQYMGVCPRLMIVGTASSGVNHIDLKYASEKNIVVKNIDMATIIPTAELVFLLMQDMGRNFYQEITNFRRGFWRSTPFGTQLFDKYLGVIGPGSLGKRVIHLGHAYNMNVMATSPNFSDSRAAELNCKNVDLDTLLMKADYVVVTARLCDSSRNLIGFDKIKLMKSSAFLINVARGGIVNEEDLTQALDMGLIAGAALDTFVEEPLPLNSKLRDPSLHNSLRLSSHVGGVTRESNSAAMKEISCKVYEFLKKQNLI